MCKCKGGTYDNWTKWTVVVRRNRPSYSRLYCLRCRWEWSSRARYIDLLDDYICSRRHGMSDNHVLSRLKEGTLVVDPNLVKVYSVRNGVRSELALRERQVNDYVSYFFVEVCWEGRKRKIAAHRLVWMSVHMKLIPKGYDVDHIDGPSNNIDNLRLLKQETNRATRGQRQELDSEYRETDLPF